MSVHIEYYERPNGHRPVQEWLDGLQQKDRQQITAKLVSLQSHGVQILLGTQMLKPVEGPDPDLYELRGGQCRVVFYYDRTRETCWLLHGFLKKGRIATKDIRTARSLLAEFLEGGGNR